MSPPRRLNYSYEDYLRALEVSQIKLEYCGQIYAMAGGTPTHAQLGARMIRLLGEALTSTCEVYTSDLKFASKRPTCRRSPMRPSCAENEKCLWWTRKPSPVLASWSK